MPARKFEHIMISRPDAIGDVVLTLPLAGMLKQYLPGVRVSFLGRNYTRDVVACCKHVDAFYSLDDWGDHLVEKLQSVKPDAIVHAFPHEGVVKASRQAGIPVRVGTARRWHTLTNLTHRHWFSRKKSDLHEAQLNAKLLSSFGISIEASLKQIPEFYGFTKIPEAPAWALELLSDARPNLIFHPKSKGSAVDWPLHKWASLIASIDPSEARIFVSGTEAEGALFRSTLPLGGEEVHDISGRMNLAEFIGFIARCDGLVACSTGPLHIASALGIRALGLYTNQRPMHAGRWAPVGSKADVLEAAHVDHSLPFEAAEVRKKLLLKD